MAGKSSFLIIAFDRNPRGKLQPCAPARLHDKDAAEFAARLIAGHHAGVAVIEEPRRVFAEPRLVATIGKIPVETLAIFGVSSKGPQSRGRRALAPSMGCGRRRAAAHRGVRADPREFIS